MIIPRALCLSLVLNISLASAYFSSGWSPSGTDTAAGSTPSLSGSNDNGAGAATSGGFDWTVVLKQGPIGELFKLAGVNVTERLEAAKLNANKVHYDTRIPMITDENYESLVREGNKDDTWFIVVTLGTAQDPMSKLVDEAYDEAYNTSVIAKDLSHVQWGRLDYMNVTRVTTEWMVWKAPVLVIARDQGRELRFLYPNQVSLDALKIHKFLKNSEWEDVPVWEGPFAPGGDLEKYVKLYATFATALYGVFKGIPKWLFLVGSGALGSWLISLMHSKSTPTVTAPTGSTGKGKKENGKSVPVTIVEEEKKTRPKRFVVKKASEVHPELGADARMAQSMNASLFSEGTGTGVSESEGVASDGGKRPSGNRRRSTRTKVKK